MITVTGADTVPTRSYRRTILTVLGVLAALVTATVLAVALSAGRGTGHRTQVFAPNPSAVSSVASVPLSVTQCVPGHMVQFC